MNVGVSWKHRPPQGPFDAIVIGSGIGGLAAAAGLARYGGRRVLVLERHYRIGGYTHTFARPGYEWDVGVHYLGQLGPDGAVKNLFDRLTDGSLAFAPLPDVYDRVYLGDRAYDFVTGRARFTDKLVSYFPAEADAIARYVELCCDVSRTARLFYLDKAFPDRPATVKGTRMRQRFEAGASRTTLEVLRGLTKNEELIAVLTGQYGNYGLAPACSSFAMHAGLVAHYLEGAHYPVGGAGVLAKAFAPVIEQAGGVLCHSAPVTEVLVDRGRAAGVRVASGEELRCDVVISDAGLANTFTHLVPAQHVPRPIADALAQVRPSVSFLCLYLGFEKDDEALGLTGTNLWLYADARHDENTERFGRDLDAPLPVVYASFPSAKDPTWKARSPGKATIELITPFRWDWTARWQNTKWRKRGDDYGGLKQQLAKRMLEPFLARLPHLRDQVAYSELSTPLSAQHFAGHPRGELYGLEPTPSRFRMAIHARSGLPGLYLTGTDLVTAGVAGALLGGALCAGSLLGLEAFREMTRR
ncbi:MAG: phytoene desaturase family protein [Myxococcales bacterium]